MWTLWKKPDDCNNELSEGHREKEEGGHLIYDEDFGDQV